MSSIGDLTVFYEVATAGSFVGAANRLEMTPSGVSKNISRLETRLGVRLFNRTTRAVSLTEAGTALADQCEGILGAIDHAENLVRDLSAAPQGTLRVAASDALSCEVLIPFLKSFLGTYQDLSVTLVHGDGQIDMLNERIDVALMFAPPQTTSFIAHRLIADPWIVVASPEYLATYGTPTHPHELKDHHCLTIHSRGTTIDNWNFVVDGAPQTVEVTSKFSGIGLTVKNAAVHGIGIGRLAHFLVCPAINSGALKPLFLDFMTPSDRHIHAVYPNREHLPAKVRIFIDALKAYMNREMPVPKALLP